MAHSMSNTASRSFRHIDELKGGCDMFAKVYALFLHSGNIPSSLEDEIRRLEQQQNQHVVEDEEEQCRGEYLLCM